MEFITTITVYRKDNTRRVIKVQGLWNTISATSLGKDLDGDLCKYVTVSH